MQYLLRDPSTAVGKMTLQKAGLESDYLISHFLTHHPFPMISIFSVAILSIPVNGNCGAIAHARPGLRATSKTVTRTCRPTACWSSIQFR